MKTLSINEAQELLGQLLKTIASNHEPIHIKGNGVSAVLLDEDDWRAIQETLYLVSIPGMRESIREGLDSPIDECAGELDW